MTDIYHQAGVTFLSLAIVIQAISHPEDIHSHSEIEYASPLPALTIPITGSQHHSSFGIVNNFFTQAGFSNSSGVWIEHGGYHCISGLG